MNNFRATIGIEVHTELNTLSKMFSSVAVSAYDKPNTNINEIDLGLPGVLPSPNKAAVIKGIQLATALKMEINNNLCFDRKNYFYQDLPKGFQITQQYHPIGRNGQIRISNKIIKIERIHLEEDTAKQQIINGKLCLDYNRCGIPLIEIVSQPDMETPKEAIEYLTLLKRILTFLNISDGKMEDGSFRADVNISVAPIGTNKLGTKVEIKNINSFANVGSAIEYEFQRQVRQLLKGEKVIQETRRWDENKNQTIFMRLKSDAIDYHYFREPNIVQIDINHLIGDAQKSMLKLPTIIENELLNNNVATNLIQQIMDDHNIYNVFNTINAKIHNYPLVSTWVVVELGGLLKAKGAKYEVLESNFINRFINLLKLLNNQEINGKQAKTILEKIYTSNVEPVEFVQQLGFIQIKDPTIIQNYFKKYIAENSNMVTQYKERPERVEKFFIGLLMRDTKGQANPNISIEILKKLLS